MPISPWTLGQLSPVWTIVLMRQILQSDGTLANKPVDLTGVTTGQLSLIIYNASFVQTGTGAGTFTIVDVNPGIVTYQLVSADVPSSAGQYFVRVKINFNGTTPDYCDRISWTINT